MGGSPIAPQRIKKVVEEKESEVKKEREFYPMITGTMKSVLVLTADCDLSHVIEIIINYPNYKTDGSLLDKTVITELDRQYARWNKGGANE